MRTLCTLAIVMTGAGLIAGVPLRDAQACDDDRYPCPVRAQAAQQTANMPAQPARAAKPKKKVNHARANEKASAKQKVSKPAVQDQEQAADAVSQKAAEAAPAAVPSSPAGPVLNDETRSESLVATAGTAWPVSPNTEDAGGTAETTAVNVTKAASNVVEVVDSNQADDLDRVAVATVEPSWIAYLLLTLGAALAAASATIWFFSRMRFLSRNKPVAG